MALNDNFGTCMRSFNDNTSEPYSIAGSSNMEEGDIVVFNHPGFDPLNFFGSFAYNSVGLAVSSNAFYVDYYSRTDLNNKVMDAQGVSLSIEAEEALINSDSMDKLDQLFESKDFLNRLYGAKFDVSGLRHMTPGTRLAYNNDGHYTNNGILVKPDEIAHPGDRALAQNAARYVSDQNGWKPAFHLYGISQIKIGATDHPNLATFPVIANRRAGNNLHLECV